MARMKPKLSLTDIFRRAQVARERCCGHHCPVCHNPAYPLHGCCKNDGAELDMPWRMKLGRIAHKCFTNKHRFDVDRRTGESLSEYLYRDFDGTINAYPVG